MSEELSKELATELISSLITGCCIDKVIYYVTGWELRLINSTGEEYYIYASKIEAPGAQEWWSSLSSPSFDLKNTNEPEDTAVGVAIFTVLNKWPIIDVMVDDQGNLLLHFENQCVLKYRSIVEMVDWTWSILDHEMRSLFTCDSGLLYKNS